MLSKLMLALSLLLGGTQQFELFILSNLFLQLFMLSLFPLTKINNLKRRGFVVVLV